MRVCRHGILSMSCTRETPRALPMPSHPPPPGVILNRDPDSHKKFLKPSPVASDLVGGGRSNPSVSGRAACPGPRASKQTARAGEHASQRAQHAWSDTRAQAVKRNPQHLNRATRPAPLPRSTAASSAASASPTAPAATSPSRRASASPPTRRSRASGACPTRGPRRWRGEGLCWNGGGLGGFRGLVPKSHALGWRLEEA
jgi:hypothetical protein